MKVLCYGNQGNTCFRIARWLREEGIDAHLYIPSNRFHSRSLPEWEDPSLKNNYPDWIHTQPRHFYHAFLPEKKVRKDLEEFDVVLTSGPFIISALKLNKPLVFEPVGGDINGLPFFTGLGRQSIYAALYRYRIPKLKRVITAQDNCYWSAKLWGVDNVYPISLPVDAQSINRNIDQEFYDKICERYSQHDLVLFHPTRKNMHPNERAYKAPERVLYAYKKFLDKNSDKSFNSVLITVCHGYHVEEYKEFVKNIGLETNVVFEDHLSLPKLHAYMKLPNVVVLDQFKDKIRSNLGGISREALALGALHITCVQYNDALFRQAYGTSEVPFYYANTADEICETIQRIQSLSSDDKKKICEYSRNWAYEHLDYHNQIHGIIDVLEKAAADTG